MGRLHLHAPRGRRWPHYSVRRAGPAFTSELRSQHVSSLTEILVLDGTAGTGRIAPPTSTKISARLETCFDVSTMNLSGGVLRLSLHYAMSAYACLFGNVPGYAS